MLGHGRQQHSNLAVVTGSPGESTTNTLNHLVSAYWLVKHSDRLGLGVMLYKAQAVGEVHKPGELRHENAPKAVFSAVCALP